VSGPTQDGARDVVVTLHPDQHGVLAVRQGACELLDIVADDSPPTWATLLDASRRIAPAGAWPLGPHRFAAGFRLHVVQARGHDLAAGARWSDAPDPSWPEPLQEAGRVVLDDDAGRARSPFHREHWMLRGWWEEATAWVDTLLAAAGRRRTDDLQPKEHWGISAVARVPTTAGALWLKSVPSILRREPAVLTVLVDRLPGQVPGVFAAEEGSDDLRFLLHDAGPVPDQVDARDPPRLAALLADLQVRTSDLLPRLASAGAADRSPARLASELPRLAEDGFELDLLDPAEGAQLRRLVPRLTDQLLALRDGPLPDVLVHGDFHSWNVCRPPRWSPVDAVVIDWTDAAVGPAGVDLVTLLPRSATAVDWAPVTHAYAEVWAREIGGRLAEVEEAVVAARPAAHVVQALAYDELLRVMEPATRWQIVGAMADHLRALLDTRA